MYINPIIDKTQLLSDDKTENKVAKEENINTNKINENEITEYLVKHKQELDPEFYQKVEQLTEELKSAIDNKLKTIK